jgi:hypothetical protein
MSGQTQHNYSNKRTLTISTTSGEAHGWQHHIGETSGGEYCITTEDGRVRPKHVLIEFKKCMCYIDGQKNKYSVMIMCNFVLVWVLREISRTSSPYTEAME